MSIAQNPFFYLYPSLLRGKGRVRVRHFLYQAFVRSGIKAELPLNAIKGQLFLGQENFIDEIKHLMRGKEKLKEIPRKQSYVTKPPLREQSD